MFQSQKTSEITNILLQNIHKIFIKIRQSSWRHFYIKTAPGLKFSTYLNTGIYTYFQYDLKKFIHISKTLYRIIILGGERCIIPHVVFSLTFSLLYDVRNKSIWFFYRQSMIYFVVSTSVTFNILSPRSTLLKPLHFNGTICHVHVSSFLKGGAKLIKI